jgi:hypothetical protein
VNPDYGIASSLGEPKPADLVCCIDVLEHIEPAPEGAPDNGAGVLGAGGAARLARNHAGTKPWDEALLIEGASLEHAHHVCGRNSAA